MLGLVIGLTPTSPAGHYRYYFLSGRGGVVLLLGARIRGGGGGGGGLAFGQVWFACGCFSKSRPIRDYAIINFGTF